VSEISLTIKDTIHHAIYKIDDHNKTIIIYAIGLRMDIYEIITELIR
jgi:hypothetical protein